MPKSLPQRALALVSEWALRTDYSATDARTCRRSAEIVARSRRGLAPRMKRAAQVATKAQTQRITANVLMPIS